MRASWLLLVALGACVKAGDVPCGDRVCPSETVCESVTLTCITRGQDTACSDGDGIDDGEQCRGFGFVGICQHQKCLPGCGDGALNRDVETCDDGNFRSHDGCSSSCLAETLSWEQMPDPWTGMFDHVAAYHPGSTGNPNPFNGFFVLLTGQSQALLRTQQFIARGDATSWIKDDKLRPSPRTGAAMAYDAARNKLVLFGGRAAGYFDDTWEWDFVTGWTEVNPTVRPPAREGGEVAYDTVHQRLVLFGGFNGSALLDDTWEYNGTWVQRTPTTRPGPRIKHAMAYDPGRDRVVLYGGNVFGTVTLSDHWEYDNGVWTLVAPVGPPGKRSGAAMGYTPDRNVVLFGGFTEGTGGAAGFVNDTWQYNGSSWTQVASTSTPPARSGATLTAAPANTSTNNPSFQLLLIGGEQSDGKPTLADVWRLTPTGWVDISPHGLPPARQGAPAVLDDRKYGIHIFGGIGTSIRKDVWSFEESSWNQRPPETFEAHYRHVAAYDPMRDRIVMFGGIKETPSTQITNDTFETGNMLSSWSAVVPAQSPSPRVGGVLAWSGSTLVLFGGNVSGTLTDETWTYDGATWAQDAKTGPWPQTSSQAAAAYDRVHERLVLFDRDGVTWAYADHVWTKLVEASEDDGATPPARDDASMTFDWQTRRMLLAGGRRASSNLLTDLWELDGTTWRELAPFGASPLPRALFGFSSTPFGRQTVLIGGTATGGQPAGDVWTLRYEAAGTPDEDCRNSADDDGDLRVDARDPDCCTHNVPNTCLEGP